MSEKRESNYEIMKHQMQAEFLKYDQERMIRKLDLYADETYIFIRFFSQQYRIDRDTGVVWRVREDSGQLEEADYNEAMTLYDVLCYSKDDCRPSYEYINMKSLSAIKGGSLSPGTGFFAKAEQSFDQKGNTLAKACEMLGGQKAGKGDVAYEIPMFDFLFCRLQFWNSDEEFEPSLQIFLDKNILDYMHYETVWFAVGHLVRNLEKLLGR